MLSLDMLGPIDGNMGNCPVCRKVFHVKDLEHVLNLVGSQSSHLVYRLSHCIIKFVITF